MSAYVVFLFFPAEDGIRDYKVTGVQTCALPISRLEERRVVQGAVELVEPAVRRQHARLLAQVPLADERGGVARSEERRVGKEGRGRGSAERQRKKGEERWRARKRACSARIARGI